MTETKVKNEVIGRMTCPLCDEERQDVKVNKNGNLYCNCDNNCSTRFSSKQSKEVKIFLEAGKTAKIGSRIVTPLEFRYNIAKQKEMKADEQRQDETRRVREQPRGNNVIGRADGQPAGDKPNGDNTTKSRLGAWLFDDDD